MLRRTWSITKGSLGRMRKRTTVDDGHSCDESKEFSNDHSNLDGGRYFSFARHFKRTVTGPFSTFYLNGYIDSANGDNDLSTSKNSSEEPMYSNTNNEMGKSVFETYIYLSLSPFFLDLPNFSRNSSRPLQRTRRSRTTLSILCSSCC